MNYYQPYQPGGVVKASRKRRADGRLKSASDSPLSFRESLYSEKAAAMIDSKGNSSATSSPATPSPKEDPVGGIFQFVDQSASSRREARRFVMRRSVWHRKQEQTRKMQSTVPPNSAFSDSMTPGSPTSSNDVSSPTSPQKDSDSEALPRLTIDTRSKSILPYDPVRGCSLSPSTGSSPRTMLSAARKDPFDTLPVRINDWDLVDFYHDKLRFSSSPKMMNHMKDVVWKYAASDKVTFQSTCLALTSGHRARFLPTESNIKSADYYARVTEPDLEIYLRTTRDHENVKAEKFTMVRTSQAMWEARFGSPERSHDYITAAITLVQQQQSMHPVVVTWLHYAYYMSQFHAQPSSIRVLASDASMFAMFFQNAEQLSMHQGNHTWSNRVPLRRQLFKRRSPLWKLLSAPTRRSVEVNEPLEDYPWVIMKSHKNGVAAIARLACLLYINATLLDLRWSYDHTAAYLKHLEDKVLVHEVDRYPSVEPFIWVLLEQEPNPEVRSHDRPLIVGKLLRISRKLRPEVCDWLSEVLLRNLSLELEGQTPEMGQWEGMLRQELLKIPDAASSALG